jgi:hypothetical protein
MGGKISYYYPCHIAWKMTRFTSFATIFFFLHWTSSQLDGDEREELLQKQEFDAVSGVCVAV